MAKIKRLSAEVIGQIAAGEVVENPSAAIKELVENSIDAGAENIIIDIEQGGLKSIRVVDNGSGIQREDLLLAFERHATSKLSRAEDLFNIHSLGFRGEALASIAAVSRVKLITKTEDEEGGLSVTNEGGEISDIRPAASARGTSIQVKDIFFNAPVRQKFMKQPKQETSRVAEIIKQAILSNPNISFRFKADGETIYFSSGDGKIESAILSIYGTSTLRQLKKVDHNSMGVVVEGYVGVGDLSRGNRQHQSFFINGRMLKSDVLSRALEEATRQRVMIGKFPMCVLYLTMPYETVDVNVHPNKWELRFQNEANVKQAVIDAVLSALDESAQNQPQPFFFERDRGAKSEEARVEIKPPVIESAEIKNETYKETENVPLFVYDSDLKQSSAILSSSNMPIESRADLTDKCPETRNVQTGFYEEKPLETEQQNLGLDIEKIRLIGSVFDTYILFEVGDDFIICDQHAMHERILFERLMKLHSEGALSQMLLSPVVLNLSYQEHECFLNNQGLLFDCGFDAEDFGQGQVRLHGLPVILGAPEAERSFKDAIDEILMSGNISDTKRFDRILQTACKHAIKGGDTLSMEDLSYLVKEIIDKKLKPTCPHGRPLMLNFTKRELEKRFGRIQL